MPFGSNDFLAQREKLEDEAVAVNLKSILRPPSQFKDVTDETDPPTTMVKKKMRPKIFRPTPLAANLKKSQNESSNKVKDELRDIDSSYDSQQSLRMVRMRYKRQNLD